MKVEEYITRNKTEFDDQSPNVEKLWQATRLKMDSRKIKRMQIIKWVAASFLVFLTIGALIRHEIIIKKQITSLSQINAELASKENEYNHMVNQKWIEYNQIQGNASPFEPMLLEELNQLDASYQKGLNDMKQQGYNERAVIIMLETYEKRLRIIEKLIYEKQKQIKYENRNRKVEI